MPLFFLGGAHGTGKSSLGRELAGRLSAIVLTASDLIREQGAEPSTHDKRVSKLERNQELLIRALAEYRNEARAVILDGHFCLRPTSGEAAAIPVEVFRHIAPDALLLLDGDPQVIARRLQDRDGHAYPLGSVTALVRCEHAIAHSVGDKLGVPLCVLQSPGAVDQAVEFLTRSSA